MSIPMSSNASCLHVTSMKSPSMTWAMCRPSSSGAWFIGAWVSEPPPGLRALPVAYRIARVAAACRDLQGYEAGYPCDRAANTATGTAGTGVAGDDRPLCFAAATDRAVHRWYLDEYLRQSRVVPHRDSGLARFAHFAGAILALIDMAGAMEVVEALIADDLVAAETITRAEADFAAERANVLSCRIRTDPHATYRDHHPGHFLLVPRYHA